MLIIGVSTYNRPSILCKMAQSLYASKRLHSHMIRVYDDASYELSLKMLQDIFPDASNIYQSSCNQGADAMMLKMYHDFLSTDGDVFFNGDSDLIFSSNWMEEGVRLLEQTDGVLSLFNAPRHRTIATDGELCEKESLGAAGTMFTRKVLCEFISYLEQHRYESHCKAGVDWIWSEYFRANGIRLYSTRRSLVQHIGFDGFNSHIGNVDIGDGFIIESLLNGQILNDVLYDSCKKYISLPHFYALFPFECVEQKSKIILYGWGKVGHDYAKQIMQSGYCELVAIIDKDKSLDGNVFNIDDINKFSFDYIVLATIYQEVADSMISSIKDIDEFLLEKIVYKKHQRYIDI